MEYRLLGPFRLETPGGQQRALTARERDLLALLALHAGATLSRERLIEALWGTDLPANPGNALQQRVFHARRALADDGERLVSVSGGYRLEVDPERVDAARFDRCRRQCRRSVEAGDARAATDHLTAPR